jgi:hypothetical protein
MPKVAERDGAPAVDPSSGTSSGVCPRPDALVIDVGLGRTSRRWPRHGCLGLDGSSQVIEHAGSPFSAVQYVCEVGRPTSSRARSLHLVAGFHTIFMAGFG